MKRFCIILFYLAVWILWQRNSGAFSQESTVYASVHSTKVFVVGGNNAPTGLYYQKPSDDTVWEHTGSSNVRSCALAIAPGSKSQLLFMAGGNGVHVTTDGGNSWKITTGWEITEVLSIVIDPTNWKRILCTTPYGIFRSEDGGVQWKACNMGLTSKFVSSLIIDHSNPQLLYCSTEDGVFSSDDNAKTWTRNALSVKGIRCIAQHPTDPKIIAVGTEDDGICLSRDGGKNWEKCENGIENTTFYTVVFDMKNPLVMYAGGFETGVYKSKDGGKTWHRLQEGLASLNIHGIALDPANTNRIYAGTLGQGIFRSEDGGNTWKYAGLAGSQIWSINIEPIEP
jgi:photosystem II stability/assembly factor-like uncharacterized protein